MQKPSGVWAASLTPLDIHLLPDHGLFAEHIAELLSTGCDGVVVFGTTGEAPSFSVLERKAALEALLDRGIDPGRLMVGTGCSALTDTVDLTSHAISVGVDRALVVPPFFLKDPPTAGVWDSYREVLERVGTTGWHLYLYNFPRLSGVPVTVELVASLREFHGELVVGVKDSSGDIGSLQKFLDIPDFVVMPGTERLLVEGFRLGAAGVITATGNINAAGISAVYRGLVKEAPVDDRSMLAVRSAVERLSPIPAMKAVLAERTGHGGWSRVRPPLLPLPGELGAALALELSSLDG